MTHAASVAGQAPPPTSDDHSYLCKVPLRIVPFVSLSIEVRRCLLARKEEWLQILVVFGFGVFALLEKWTQNRRVDKK